MLCLLQVPLCSSTGLRTPCLATSRPSFIQFEPPSGPRLPAQATAEAYQLVGSVLEDLCFQTLGDPGSRADEAVRA
eukprot:6481763-Amphidinium_carterae.2